MKWMIVLINYILYPQKMVFEVFQVQQLAIWYQNNYEKKRIFQMIMKIMKIMIMILTTIGIKIKLKRLKIKIKLKIKLKIKIKIKTRMQKTTLKQKKRKI